MKLHYLSYWAFIAVTVFTALCIFLLAQLEDLRGYLSFGWFCVATFGLWSFFVLRQGVSIIKQQPNAPFFLTFQMAVTGMKFFLLIIMLLFYGKVYAPPDHRFAWFLLVSFLPYFIYETWAFSEMARFK